MHRYVFTFLSAMSLMLFLAVSVLWLRSYSVHDTIACGHEYRAWLTTSAAGRLQLQSVELSVPDPPAIGWVWRYSRNASMFDYEHLEAKEKGWFHSIGPFKIGFAEGGEFLPIRRRWITLPDALLLVLTGLLPVSWIFKKCMRRRHKRGCCSHCGYDLRATPERCPECGKEARFSAIVGNGNRIEGQGGRELRASRAPKKVHPKGADVSVEE
jgi:hypothetical protein